MNEIIKPGDYVLIQREEYMKLHKMKEKGGTITLGTFKVELDALLGEKYFTQFQMQRKSNNHFTLKKVQNDQVETYNAININQSGKDNRFILDDGQSQQMSKEEIEKLMEDNTQSSEILQKLINNSKTFDMKTEYSQEKYIKKKFKKYYCYITVRKPSIRLLANVFYKLESNKIQTTRLRSDELSQILTYANIQAGGKYILYDSGSNAILPAAILNLIGRNNDGRLVYMHPGNECQKQALLAMQFPEEQLNRCINVNIFSVLRWFYQQKSVRDEYVLPEEQQKLFDQKQKMIVEEQNRKQNGGKQKHNAEKQKISLEEEQKQNGGKQKNDSEETETETGTKRKLEATSATPEEEEEEPIKKPKRPNWHYQNEAACEIFRQGVDAVIIASKEHPVSISTEFLQFLNPSRSFVTYSTIKEPLQDLYFSLVNRSDLTNVKLSSNFMRNYQVLPERTHPLVNMNFGGFLLTALKLKSPSS